MNSRSGFILALAAVMAVIFPADRAAAGERPGRDDPGRFKPRAESVQGHSVPAHPDGPARGPVQGKAGVDRFVIDPRRVSEYARADGTVIMNLNGEGMEKMELAGEAGSLRAVCASMLEMRRGRTSSVPADFRGRGNGEGAIHARR